MTDPASAIRRYLAWGDAQAFLPLEEQLRCGRLLQAALAARQAKQGTPSPSEAERAAWGHALEEAALARTRMVETHRLFVVKLVKRYVIPYQPTLTEDALLRGTLALVQALDYYDPARGKLFVAFAYRRVQQALQILVAQAGNVSLPRSVWLERTRQAVTRDEHDSHLMGLRHMMDLQELDETMCGERAVEVVSGATQAGEAAIEAAMERLSCAQLLATLPPLAAQVLQAYFSVDETEVNPITAVCERFELPAEVVRGLVSDALTALRSRVVQEGLGRAPLLPATTWQVWLCEEVRLVEVPKDEPLLLEAWLVACLERLPWQRRKLLRAWWGIGVPQRSLAELEVELGWSMERVLKALRAALDSLHRCCTNSVASLSLPFFVQMPLELVGCQPAVLGQGIRHEL